MAAASVLSVVTGFLGGMFLFRSAGPSHVWRLAVPVCGVCKEAGRPRTLFVEDRTETISYVVNVDFADQFRRLNDVTAP